MFKKTAIGVTLPIKRAQTGYFNQSFSVIEQARSNLTNLILTEKGERLMQPEFGCNLHKVLFEPSNVNVVSRVQEVIDNAVAEWLPYIGLKDVQVLRDDDTNTLYVKVEFFLTNSPAISDIITVSF